MKLTSNSSKFLRLSKRNFPTGVRFKLTILRFSRDVSFIEFILVPCKYTSFRAGIPLKSTLAIAEFYAYKTVRFFILLPCKSDIFVFDMLRISMLVKFRVYRLTKLHPDISNVTHSDKFLVSSSIWPDIFCRITACKPLQDRVSNLAGGNLLLSWF